MKIFIEKRHQFKDCAIWMQERDLSHTRNYTYKDGAIECNTLENNSIYSAGNEIKPFLSLPVDFFELLAIEMSNYVAHSGIKTEAESTTKGKLEATELHLKDLQLFLGKTIDKLTK